MLWCAVCYLSYPAINTEIANLKIAPMCSLELWWLLECWLWISTLITQWMSILYNICGIPDKIMENGKWKSAFLHLQVFSLTVGNEKGEGNYVREVQDAIIRTTLCFFLWKGSIKIQIIPAAGAASVPFRNREMQFNSACICQQIMRLGRGNPIKGVSISALSAGSRIVYCLIIVSFTFDPVNFTPLLQSHICFVAQL